MQQLTRRTAILGALGLGAGALAGCITEDDGPAADDETGDDDTGDENNGAGDGGNDDTALSGSIERVGSDCAGPDPGVVYADEENGVYTVEGTLPSPTPCYEPVLDSTALADGTLSLTVDVVEEELDGDCVTCSGKVLYEATIEGADPAAVDRVEVTHATGETDTVEADDFSTRRPELIDAEIKESVSDARSSETDDESQIDLAELSSVSESETGAIELHGTIPTNTPHYEAVLDDASVQGTALEVAIDVESTLDDEDDESDAGTQVLGVVFYIAMFEIRNIDALDSVRIDHPQSGHGITWESDSETAERGHSHETSNTSTNESE
jgi:hypothetical protein